MAFILLTLLHGCSPVYSPDRYIRHELPVSLVFLFLVRFAPFPGNFTSTVSGHRCCDFCANSCTCGEDDCEKETKLPPGHLATNHLTSTKLQQPVLLSLDPGQLAV